MHSQSIGYVYFVHSPLVNLIKIGFSTHYPDGRLADLKVGSPVPLERLSWIYADIRTEKNLHARFAHLRSHGEWFRAEADLLGHVRRRGTVWRELGTGYTDPTPTLKLHAEYVRTRRIEKAKARKIVALERIIRDARAARQIVDKEERRLAIFEAELRQSRLESRTLAIMFGMSC